MLLAESSLDQPTGAAAADAMTLDERWMAEALDAAARAERLGEVPIGAVVVRDGERLATAWNAPIASCDPTAHAEIAALRSAGRVLGNYRLTGSTLYVTLEPCLMCLGAMLHARIDRLVFGAADPKVGATSQLDGLARRASFNHAFVVEGGVLAETSARLLRSFFQRKRCGEVPKWS